MLAKRCTNAGCYSLQSDHEKYIQRAREVQEVRSQDAPAASTDAGKLYQKQDLRLKEGETIKYVRNAAIIMMVANGHFPGPVPPLQHIRFRS